MLDIDMEFKKGILFVRLNGIINGDNILYLDNNLKIIKDNGIRYVLLNLDGISYIDRYGVNTILEYYGFLKNINGKLIICKINKLFNYNNQLVDGLYQVSNEDYAYKLVSI